MPVVLLGTGICTDEASFCTSKQTFFSGKSGVFSCARNLILFYPLLREEGFFFWYLGSLIGSEVISWQP